MNYNQYTMEQHTVVGLSYGALTADYVGTPWIDMRWIDALDFLLLKELGTAGKDPEIRWRGRPKNGLAATHLTLRPHYLVKKLGDTAAAIKGVGFSNALGDLSATNVWTDLTSAEDAMVLVAAIFPEDLVRTKAGLVEVRMEVKGSSADAAQFYMATALARLKDAEPIYGPMTTQRVK